MLNGGALNLIRDRYIGKLARYTKLDKDEREALEHKTASLSAEKAKS
jgi:hypothetical protein